MQFLPILTVAFSFFASAPLRAADPENAASQSLRRWGTLRGVVQVEGDFTSLPLRARKGDAIYYRGSMQDSINRVPPKKAGVFDQDIPDRSALVDAKSQGLGNVFVYLRRRPAEVHPERDHVPTENLSVVWNEWNFEPRALVVRTGQKIVVRPHSPTTLIQVTSLPSRNSGFNQLIGGIGVGGKPRFETKFFEPEELPVRVTNQFGYELARHEPDSTTYWLVLDHPYGTISATDGRFEIRDLPAGEHELAIWHERLGHVVRKLKAVVRPDETTALAPIKVTADRLKASR